MINILDLVNKIPVNENDFYKNENINFVTYFFVNTLPVYNGDPIARLMRTFIRSS